MSSRTILLAGLVALSTARSRAALAAAATEQVAAEARPAAGEPEPVEPNWRVAAAAYVYFVPESSDYVQPTLRADHRLLHLEARYSYEDLLTGSAWAGVNAAGGDTVWWEITPMFGGVFGRTNGVAFGYEGAVGWWKLDLYSEGEWVVDFAYDDFFFNWSELTIAPREWFRVGLVAQRTRVFSSGRELERGLLAGVSWGWADLALHVLNPDDARPIVIVAFAGSFDW